MKKTFALLLTLLLAAALLVGCTGTAPVAPDAPAADVADAPGAVDAPKDDGAPKGRIGFSIKTITNDAFQQRITDYARGIVEEAGYEFVLTIAGSGDASAVDQQVKNIEDLVNMMVDGIIVVPMDDTAPIPALQKAKAAGIPVVVADAGIAEGNEDLYEVFVGTNNFESAKAAGEHAVKLFPDGAKAIIVRGASGAKNAELRSNGFMEGIKGSKIEIVNQAAGDWVNDTAMKVTENMLQANPEVNLLFTNSDVMFDGIWAAIENSGRKPGDITVISHDGFALAVDAIKTGKMNSCFMQDPIGVGETAAKFMIKILEGTFDPAKEGVVNKSFDTGFRFMDLSNVDEMAQYTF